MALENRTRLAKNHDKIAKAYSSTPMNVMPSVQTKKKPMRDAI
jgi:hypothetical protein